MSKTVVGLFSTMAQANQVKSILSTHGYEEGNIDVVANDEADLSSGTATTTEGGAAGIGEKIGSYFRNLTGGDETAHHHYATGVNQGGALLTAKVQDEKAYEVAALLKQYGARDIESEEASVTPTSAAGYEGDAVGETAIPIIEEQLVVGKREVDRGGVRIYSHVTEKPVEAAVTLREEQFMWSGAQ